MHHNSVIFSNFRIENDTDKVSLCAKRQAEIDFRSEHLKNECIITLHYGGHVMV